MLQKVKYGIAFALALMLVGNASAQIDNTATITKTGTAAAQFLKIGVDARSAAMGSAFAAMGGSLGSIHTNPAGLAKIQGMEAVFTHQEWLADINFNYFAFAFKIAGFGALGASVTSLSTPEDIVRTVEQPDGTGERFSSNDLAINLSYSRELTDRFSIGANMKFIRQNIWHSNANGAALDFGVLFTMPIRNIRLGASLTNFGANMRMQGRDLRFSEDPDPNNQGNVEFINAALETDAFALPLAFRVGISGELIRNDNIRVSFAMDAIEPNDNSSSVNSGLEFEFSETLSLRSGYARLFQQDAQGGLTFGAGLKMRPGQSASPLFIDYAYGNFGVLESVHRFSIGMKF